jgi:hypothetical protein
MVEINVESTLSRPKDFLFGEVSGLGPHQIPLAPPPNLGPLTAFNGVFTGNGFNTIFRPNLGSPTPLPTPPIGPNDNVLELNLTSEVLSFSPPLGSVPNRGEVQPDIFLNGVPYLQSITDVTTPTDPIGIHVEPGLWMSVEPTTDPAEGATLVRMASIPHGTTIDAQGTWTIANTGPTIPSVSITPVGAAPFPSQTATTKNTWRIPQDLTSYLAAGTITQAMLDDPNSVLVNAIAGQKFASTTTISISTDPASPLFGGGTDNIAFLLGNAAATTPNAQTVEMSATFRIETVEHTLVVPPFKPGQPPLKIPVESPDPQRPVPTFHVNPPVLIPKPIEITLTFTQIQYSQMVMLNFNGLVWPHVSVATLVPNGLIPIPPSVWDNI